eukprot:m.272223 g.272223  ORF g.272223 m.272223 type:complete len:65 (+) comp90344_c0_seq1:50-244(+)
MHFCCGRHGAQVLLALPSTRLLLPSVCLYICASCVGTQLRFPVGHVAMPLLCHMSFVSVVFMLA